MPDLEVRSASRMWRLSVCTSTSHPHARCPKHVPCRVTSLSASCLPPQELHNLKHERSGEVQAWRQVSLHTGTRAAHHSWPSHPMLRQMSTPVGKPVRIHKSSLLVRPRQVPRSFASAQVPLRPWQARERQRQRETLDAEYETSQQADRFSAVLVKLARFYAAIPLR